MWMKRAADGAGMSGRSPHATSLASPTQTRVAAAGDTREVAEDGRGVLVRQFLCLLHTQELGGATWKWGSHPPFSQPRELVCVQWGGTQSSDERRHRAQHCP